MEKSRIEHILKYGLGEVSTLPPNLSRVEELLKRLIEGSISPDTKIVSIGGRVDTVSELPQTAAEGTLYFVGYASDTSKAEYVMTSSGEWELLGFNNLVIDSALSATSLNPVENRVIYVALGNKVDSIQGKQLSTEDYTTAEKTKLATLENYDDSQIVADISALQTSVSGKVDAVSGMGLSQNSFTDAEKTKLGNCKTIWQGTQSEYDSLVSKTYDLYMIYEEESQNGD